HPVQKTRHPVQKTRHPVQNSGRDTLSDQGKRDPLRSSIRSSTRRNKTNTARAHARASACTATATTNKGRAAASRHEKGACRTTSRPQLHATSAHDEASASPRPKKELPRRSPQRNRGSNSRVVLVL